MTRLTESEYLAALASHEILSDTGAQFPSGTNRSGVKRTEHDEQVAVFRWAQLNELHWPCLRWMFAIPNGGKRATVTAVRLKAEGAKAGVPDIFLPYPTGGYCGLWIEMKIGSNKPTGYQREWLVALSSSGYQVAVCYGADEAIAALQDYLGGER